MSKIQKKSEKLKVDAGNQEFQGKFQYFKIFLAHFTSIFKNSVKSLKKKNLKIPSVF